MNHLGAAEKLLSLLGARAQLIRTYGWQPVLATWALMFSACVPLVALRPLGAGELAWQFLPMFIYPFFLGVLRFMFPARFAKLAAARLLGFWNLAWAVQTFLVLVIPLTGVTSPNGALMLSVSLFLALMVLTGLLKQLRPLMVLGLLSWLALMGLWLFLPVSLRQLGLCVCAALTATLAAFVRPESGTR